MVPEIGNLCLYLSLALSALILLRTMCAKDFSFTKKLWLLNLGFISLTFLCLIFSFAVSDFSVLSVANHSHTDKPLIYKVSAAWGHHEGSMLMWLAAIIFFSCFFVYFAQGNLLVITLASGVQALILVLYTSYTIFASNPFIRIFPVPVNGLGLNPVLQDIGLAMHPPMLYLGYVGFSLAFSSAVALLLHHVKFKDWAIMVGPWVMLSWSFLTLGIGLGSWWAYRELGWGGFWFWDPVENASLMPWLSGTALIHALNVGQKRDMFKSWAIFLAILTFSLSMTGTFLVRSGIITSVHSFAVDPTRGVYVLAILGFLVMGAMLLFSARAHRFSELQRLHLFSREGFIAFNNMLFFCAAVIVFFGTLYPFVLELFANKQIAVGAPYYNKLMGPLALIVLVLATIGSGLSWKKEKVGKLKKLLPSLLLSISLTLVIQAYFGFNAGIGVFLTMCSLWLLIAMLTLWYFQKPKLSNPVLAMLVAHAGFALVLLGISLNATYKDQAIAVLPKNGTIRIQGYTLTLEEISYKKLENYLSRYAKIEVREKGGYPTVAYPETRLYLAQKQQTTESAIIHKPLYDLYIVIGELQENGQIITRVFYEPGISFIWFGCFVMFFGGIWRVVISCCRHPV